MRSLSAIRPTSGREFSPMLVGSEGPSGSGKSAVATLMRVRT